MNYTSIEQSKKLLELGLSPETADMFYIEGSSAIGINVPFVKESEMNRIPCWSVGALIKVICETCDRCEINLKINKEWNIFIHAYESYSFYNGTGFYTVLNACTEAVVWLLGNGYIKKRK